jgi:hypothetical protein
MADVRAGAMAPREDPDTRVAFRPWEVDREHAPECWDARRLAAVPTGERREKAWLARRKHAPCCTKIPAAWGLDCIYLRSQEEEGYARRLSELLRNPPECPADGVSLALVCLDRPLVPLRWPVLSRPTWDPVREFPVTGQLCIPGDDVPRDSAYALFRASGLAELGDPGRFIREYRREKRDRRRNVLVSWSQVEFFEIPTSARGALYPALPEWWDEVEVSTAMSVPLPPVLTYRGSGLIRGDPLHWAIFRSEWTGLVFGRWCVDLCYRGVMWHLRPKLRDWIGKVGVEALLEGSGFDVPMIQRALLKHDSREWANWWLEGRGDNNGVPVSCTRGDLAFLDPSPDGIGETPENPILESVPTTGWPLEVELHPPMEPHRVTPVPGRPVLRSAPLPEYAETSVPHRVAMDKNNGPRAADSGGENSDFLRRLGAMEVGVWEEVWSYSRSGVMDAEAMANACRGMFLAMRTQAVRAEQLTRERDALRRERDEAEFTLGLRAVRLRTLAQELDREAASLSAVESRQEVDRPHKRSRYDEYG